MAPTPELDDLVAALRREGLSVDGVPGDLVVAPRGPGGPAAVVEITERDLHEYVADIAATYGRDLEDPWTSARGLAAVHVVEHLTTDHGGEVNRVRLLALRRRGGGVRLEEERTDDPPPAPETGGAPHDDPAVFATELEALADHLRAQGLDVVADSTAATVRVARHGAGTTTVDLRPDRYRRHLEASEEELDAIGGDPREHAWQHWCHRVLAALTLAPETPRRLSFVESPEGEVHLVADAVGDETPEPRYVWSAEPGT